jgi:hypothetical protein
MNYGRIFFGFVLALLVVGVLAGIGWTAYNAGIAQGVVESGRLVVPAEGNTAPIAPYYAPYGMYRPFGFGWVACLIPLFFFLLLFGLFRFLFRPPWARGWGAYRMGGGWDPSSGDVPERVKEWHRRLHEQTDENSPAR